MAIAKTSAAVSTISGKLNGSVFYSGAGGLTIASVRKSSGSISEGQNRALIRRQLLTRLWGLLTPDERQTWLACRGQYHISDRFGRVRSPSGYDLYMLLNSNYLALYDDVLGNCPPPSAFTDLPLTSIESAIELGSVFVNFANGLASNIPANTVAVIFATPPQSQGITRLPSNQLKKITTIPSGTPLPVNIYNQLTATLGSHTIAPGNRICITSRFHNESNGLPGVMTHLWVTLT
jgi:hypothetical protein